MSHSLCYNERKNGDRRRMNEKLRDYLANVPCVGEDAYNELSQIIDEKVKSSRLTYPEKDRLYYELNAIKNAGAAKLFLFALNALKGFSADEYCFFIKENNSFINYFLRLTSVNPVKYGLPFELFFNADRNCFPKFCFYIKNGAKERLLNNIGDYYKSAKLLKGNDNGCRYFIDMVGKIKSDIENDGSNRAAVEIKVATVSADELAKRGLFEFDVLEFVSNEIVGKDFSDEEIYEEAIRTVAYKPAIISMKPFEKIEDVKAIVGSTGGKLIFQEQVVEILNKVFGFTPMESDCIRKSICTKKHDYNKEVVIILHNKFGTDGDEFFDYFRKYGVYTVSKGYVVAKMKNNIILEKE